MAMRASAMACSLFVRSRSRQRRSSARILTGVAAGNALQSGSARSTPARISLTDSPEKARFAVSNSYSTTPKVQYRRACRRCRREPAPDSCMRPCRG